MDDEEPATLEGQFYEFARLNDTKRDGLTITLYRSDYWMRQSKIIDDRKVTMTDTGILFNKWCKTELDWDEWNEFLTELCTLRELNEEEVKTIMTNCGLPGTSQVVVPQYRDFFLTYKPKEKMILSTLREWWVKNSVIGSSPTVLPKRWQTREGKHTIYCNLTFDNFLCWPPTPSSSFAYQKCPPMRLGNQNGLAFRECNSIGGWVGRDRNVSTNPVGWTNYTDCYALEVRSLYHKVFDSDATRKFETAERTRYLEIVGFSVSLIALVVSLIIFCHFRSLYNNRTRIHKNLFAAMVVQVIIRLTLYIDQALIRSMLGEHTMYKNVPIRGIDNMPFLCESCYVLLEYANTSMFMWMLVEGLYLHKMVTASALRERICYSLYYIAGWGVPVLITGMWAVPTAFYYGPSATCWWGYNFSSYYWILQVPRFSVIVMNMIFLLNIIRVLVEKMQQTNSTEMEKAKKAVRAALVLLPLLGITNLLNMIEAPLDKSFWEFALWCYVTHFFTSFQGFFIAIIYCFLNGEVRAVLGKHFENYLAMRQDNVSFFMNSNSRTNRNRNRSTEMRSGERWFLLKRFQAKLRVSDAQGVTEIEPPVENQPAPANRSVEKQSEERWSLLKRFQEKPRVNFAQGVTETEPPVEDQPAPAVHE